MQSSSQITTKQQHVNIQVGCPLNQSTSVVALKALHEHQREAVSRSRRRFCIGLLLMTFGTFQPAKVKPN